MDEIEEEKLVSIYSELLNVQRKIINIAKMDRFDEQIDQMKILEQQKISYKASINMLRLKYPYLDQVSDEESQQLTSYITELKQLNEEVHAILHQWYTEDSNDMKNVNSQRKTLSSYGGVHNSEILSYYIDYKK